MKCNEVIHQNNAITYQLVDSLMEYISATFLVLILLHCCKTSFLKLGLWDLFTFSLFHGIGLSGVLVNIHSAIAGYNVILHRSIDPTYLYIHTQTQLNLSDKLTGKVWNYHNKSILRQTFWVREYLKNLFHNLLFSPCVNIIECVK